MGLFISIGEPDIEMIYIFPFSKWINSLLQSEKYFSFIVNISVSVILGSYIVYFIFVFFAYISK